MNKCSNVFGTCLQKEQDSLSVNPNLLSLTFTFVSTPFQIILIIGRKYKLQQHIQSVCRFCNQGRLQNKCDSERPICLMGTLNIDITGVIELPSNISLCKLGVVQCTCTSTSKIVTLQNKGGLYILSVSAHFFVSCGVKTVT